MTHHKGAAPINISDAVYTAQDAGSTMGADVLRRIWAMIARYQGRMCAAILCACLGAFMQLVPPFAVAGITSSLLMGDTDAAVTLAIALPNVGTSRQRQMLVRYWKLSESSA